MRIGASPAAMPGGPRCRDLRSGAPSWPTIAVGSYIDRTQELSPWGSCTDNWLHAAGGGAAKFGAPLRAEAELLRAVDAVHRLEQVRHAERCVSPTTASITRAARSRCGRSSRARRPRSTLAAEGWRNCRASGAWASPRYDLDFDGFPEYFLTSMADNKLQTLARRADRRRAAETRHMPTWPIPKGVTAHRPLHAATT